MVSFVLRCRRAAASLNKRLLPPMVACPVVQRVPCRQHAACVQPIALRMPCEQCCALQPLVDVRAHDALFAECTVCSTQTTRR